MQSQNSLPLTHVVHNAPKSLGIILTTTNLEGKIPGTGRQVKHATLCTYLLQANNKGTDNSSGLSTEGGINFCIHGTPLLLGKRGNRPLLFSQSTHLLYRRLVNWLPGHYTARGHRVTCVTLHYIQTARSILVFTLC